MRDECLLVGIDEWTGSNILAHHDIPAFVETLIKRSEGEGLPEGWVLEATYWIVDAGRVVGELQVRPTLNDRYEQFGGNVGYFVHPAYRRRGIATFALRESLKILAKLGVSEPLITCRDDNVASIRVIENCGGVRIADSTMEGPRRRRYRLHL
jgi:predicted acetyltransferase